MDSRPSIDISSRTASLLFSATLASTILGIFLGLYFYFASEWITSLRIATFLLVGTVGLLSFLRHSVFYKSDQARMGWHQENPRFQIEVGFANLAIGVAGLAAALLWWGPLACGMALLTYGLYIACTLLLHTREAFSSSSEGKRGLKRMVNAALFTISLLGFAAFAFGAAGAWQ